MTTERRRYSWKTGATETFVVDNIDMAELAAAVGSLCISPPPPLQWTLPHHLTLAFLLPLASDVRNLSAAACVCTAWNRAAFCEPSLWRRTLCLDASHRLVLDDARLAVLVHRTAGQLRFLDLSDCAGISAASLPLLANQPRLVDLRMRGCNVNDAALCFAFAGCDNFEQALDVLCDEGEDASQALGACRAIAACYCHRDDDIDWNRLRDPSSALLDVLERFPTSAAHVEVACLLTNEFSTVFEDGEDASLAEASQRVCVVLRLHAQDAVVTKEAIRTLCFLLDVGERQGDDSVPVASEGVPSLIAVLRELGASDPDKTGLCFHALTRACCDETFALAALDGGILPLIFRSLAFTESEAIIMCAVLALFNLCLAHSRRDKCGSTKMVVESLFLRPSEVSLFIRRLQAFLDNATLHYNGCVVIVFLAINDNANAVIESGGLSYILTVIASFNTAPAQLPNADEPPDNSARVVLWAWSAIKTLLPSPGDSCEDRCELSTLLISALQTFAVFAGDAGVLREVLSAVIHIFYFDLAPYTDLLRSLSVAAVHVVLSHPTDLALTLLGMRVVERVCLVLKDSVVTDLTVKTLMFGRAVWRATHADVSTECLDCIEKTVLKLQASGARDVEIW